MPDSVVNLGSGEEIAIIDLVQMIHQKTESKSSLEIGTLPNRPTEIWRMSSEAKIAKKKFGWSPNIKFEDGLERTIAWYRSYLKAFYEKDSILHKL